MDSVARKDASSLPSPLPEQIAHIDTALLNAIVNEKSRAFVLEIDIQVEQFLLDSTAKRRHFPPMSPFQRLVVHRTADCYAMDHIIAPDSDGNRVVVLIKKPNSMIPSIRFAEVAVILDTIMTRQSPSIGPLSTADSVVIQVEKLPKMKIMRRQSKKNSDISSDLNEKGFTLNSRDSLEHPSKILQKKEELYNKVRAEIFCDSNPDDGVASEEEVPNDTMEQKCLESEPQLYVRNTLPQRLSLHSTLSILKPISWSNALEIYDLPPKLPNYMIDMLLEDVKQLGASIEWLQGYRIIAIFPSAQHAQHALDTVSNIQFKLRWWTP